MTQPGGYWVAMILPVWYEVEWVLLNLEFWGLAGNLMHVRQGKRLFGLIGAGELIAGAIVGADVSHPRRRHRDAEPAAHLGGVRHDSFRHSPCHIPRFQAPAGADRR